MVVRVYLGMTFKNGVLCICWLVDNGLTKAAYLFSVVKNQTECSFDLAMRFLEQIAQEEQVIVNSCSEKIHKVPKARQVVSVQKCQHELINQSFKLSHQHIASLKLNTLMVLNL